MPRFLYLYKDHLGSLDLITDAAGQIVQEQSFDAWGQRRDAVNWQDLLAAQLTGFDHSLTTRGFTGHEMLDEVGIIHMNGRIYDPKLGRFLQADPFIQEPTNTQSLNRYSYVLNNPLNATDPSGYFFGLDDLAILAVTYAVGKLAASFDIPILSAVANIAGCIYGGNPYACSASAFGSTYGLTGDLGAALKGGVASFIAVNAFDAIGASEFWGATGTPQNILANGLVGGIMSVLQDGKFGHGFLSAGITAAFKPLNNKFFGGQNKVVHRVVVAAIVGGTISELTGGKFANGAITGAFAQAFNEDQLAKEKNSQYEDSLFGPDNLHAVVEGKALSVLTTGTVEIDPLFLNSAIKRGVILQFDGSDVQACWVDIVCGGVGLGPFVGGLVEGELSLLNVARENKTLGSSAFIATAGKGLTVGGKLVGGKYSFDGLGIRFGGGAGGHMGVQGCEMTATACVGTFD